MIVERPFLNSIKAVMSTYTLTIKFLLGSSVGTVRGEQRIARESFTLAMKSISLNVGDLLTSLGRQKNQVLCFERESLENKLLLSRKRL